MILTNSILTDIRESLGLSADDNSFDKDIIPHINASIGKLNQNGIGRVVIVNNETTTWDDLQDPNQNESNQYFPMTHLFIALNTKVLFDPPPPSSVEHHVRTIDELLWRLKVFYENMEGDI